MTTIIRSASEPDLDVLCDLYYEFHEFHACHLPAYLQSLGEPTQDERKKLGEEIMKILEAGHSAILVAEEAGRIIGFAEIYLNHPDLNDRARTHTTYAHLQSLSVTQVFRRKGIGSLLLHAAEAWAQQRGAVELCLDIWEHPLGPLAFYQKAGYHTFRRSLTKNI